MAAGGPQLLPGRIGSARLFFYSPSSARLVCPYQVNFSDCKAGSRENDFKSPRPRRVGGGWRRSSPHRRETAGGRVCRSPPPWTQAAGCPHQQVPAVTTRGGGRNRPQADADRLVLNIVPPQASNVTKGVYGIYHGRFIEMLPITTALRVCARWTQLADQKGLAMQPDAQQPETIAEAIPS